MRFMLPVDEAARRFVRAIDAGTTYTVIPWQMGVVVRLLRLLPTRCSTSSPAPTQAARARSCSRRPQPSWVMAGRYFLPSASATIGWVTWPLHTLRPAQAGVVLQGVLPALVGQRQP